MLRCRNCKLHHVARGPRHPQFHILPSELQQVCEPCFCLSFERFFKRVVGFAVRAQPPGSVLGRALALCLCRRLTPWAFAMGLAEP